METKRTRERRRDKAKRQKKLRKTFSEGFYRRTFIFATARKKKAGSVTFSSVEYNMVCLV